CRRRPARGACLSRCRQRREGSSHRSRPDRCESRCAWDSWPWLPTLRRELACINRAHAMERGEPRLSIAGAFRIDGKQARFPQMSEPVLLLTSEDLVVDVVFETSVLVED